MQPAYVFHFLRIGFSRNSEYGGTRLRDGACDDGSSSNGRSIRYHCVADDFPILTMRLHYTIMRGKPRSLLCMADDRLSAEEGAIAVPA